METGNRLLMWLLFGIVALSTAAAFALEWQGRQGAIAFIGLASTALGVLSPSPFQKPHPDTPSTGATGDNTVVNQPAAPVVVDAATQQDGGT